MKGVRTTDRSRTRRTAVLGSLWLLYLVYLVLLFGSGLGFPAWLTGLTYVPIFLGAGAFMLHSAHRTAEPSVWRLLGLGTLLWGLGQIVFVALGLHSGPFSPADALFLALPVCFLLAFRVLERQDHSLSVADRLDVAALVVAAGAYLWFFVLAAPIDGNTPLPVRLVDINIAYPLSDLLLLTLLLARAWRGPVRGQRWSLTLALGMGCFVLADLGYVALIQRDLYTGQNWPDAVWPLAALLFAQAARQASTPAVPLPRHALPPRPGRVGAKALFAPYAALGSSFALLLTLREVRTPEAFGVLIATFVVALLVAARQTLSLRQLDTQRHELEVSRARLHHQAHHDPLTGLGNRTGFDRLMSHALGRPEPLGLLFIDLDDFKFVNDALGHRAGDSFLQEVARRLQQTVGAAGECFRFGGDEFLVLVQPTNGTALEELGLRLLSTLRDPVSLAGQTIQVSACLGMALAGDDARDAQTLLRRADLAMYSAKRSGKNGVRLYIPGRHDGVAARRVLLETRLRGALERQEFRLYYQPQQERDGRWLCFEALLRWNDAELGHVSPQEFVAVAEDAGLMPDLGGWVLREACRQLALWRAEGHTERQVAINLSPVQLGQPGFVEEVRHALDTHALPPEAVELEVTERLLVTDDEQAEQTLRALRDLGVQIAVDDFGVGQSSLAALLRLPTTTLKIDRAFVRELDMHAPGVPQPDPDPASAVAPSAALKVIQAVVALGRGLGLRVVAEGVETEEQARMIWALGCDAIQGYWISPARTAEDGLLGTPHGPSSGSDRSAV